MSGPRRRQTGAVLVIALILMGVIAVSTAMAMRLSLFGEMVSYNLRAQNLALQAAESGLRHCERLIVTARDSTVMVQTGLPLTDEWADPALWTSAGHDVPAAQLDDAVPYAQLPRCLIRHMTLAQFRGGEAPSPGAVSVESRGIPPERVVFYRVTARGFSPDYRENVSGAEVWLQTMIRAVE